VDGAARTDVRARLPELVDHLGEDDLLVRGKVEIEPARVRPFGVGHRLDVVHEDAGSLIRHAGDDQLALEVARLDENRARPTPIRFRRLGRLPRRSRRSSFMSLKTPYARKGLDSRETPLD